MPTAHSSARASPLRVASIDVGSNAVRLLVAKHDAKGLTTLAEDRQPTQLAKDLASTGRLNPAGVEASLDALRRFRATALHHNVHLIRAVATAAVRDAADGPRFVALVLQKAGITLETISGDEEAALAFLSLSHRFDIAESPAAAIDIGGGSAQIILSTHGVAVRTLSLPLGAVRLTDEFGPSSLLATKAFPKLRRHADAVIARALDRETIRPSLLAGTGGTITAVADLLRPRGTAQKVDDAIDHSAIRKLIRLFRAHAPNPPPAVARLSPDRANVLLAGVIVLERLMHHLGADVVHTHHGGLREGICWSLVDQHRLADSPRDAALDLAHRCRFERPHALHVEHLAARLLHHIRRIPRAARILRTHPRAAQLLSAAAILHDVGVLVGYAKHHKHSRDIILSACIPGFSRREILIIANLARYHRRVGPRPSHRLFAALSDPEQNLVRLLAGVLRVADGFDRSHAAFVRDVLASHDSRTLRLTPQTAPASTDDARAERRTAQRKADVLAEALGLRVRIEPPPR
jgi:exopolyphosphatase/guanosine-5'-triphosphate,3'-diphosphate pyrophosphatase